MPATVRTIAPDGGVHLESPLGLLTRSPGATWVHGGPRVTVLARPGAIVSLGRGRAEPSAGDRALEQLSGRSSTSSRGCRRTPARRRPTARVRSTDSGPRCGSSSSRPVCISFRRRSHDPGGRRSGSGSSVRPGSDGLTLTPTRSCGRSSGRRRRCRGSCGCAAGRRRKAELTRARYGFERASDRWEALVDDPAVHLLDNCAPEPPSPRAVSGRAPGRQARLLREAPRPIGGGGARSLRDAAGAGGHRPHGRLQLPIPARRAARPAPDHRGPAGAGSTTSAPASRTPRSWIPTRRSPGTRTPRWPDRTRSSTSAAT